LGLRWDWTAGEVHPRFVKMGSRFLKMNKSHFTMGLPWVYHGFTMGFNHKHRFIWMIWGLKQPLQVLSALPPGGQTHPQGRRGFRLRFEKGFVEHGMGYITILSMDWFKGKSTGNHGFYHQI